MRCWRLLLLLGCALAAVADTRTSLRGGSTGAASYAEDNVKSTKKSKKRSTVQRVKVANSNFTISRPSLGGLHFPEMKNNITELVNVLETAISLGITTIDTADVYGWYQDGHGVTNDLLGQAFSMKPGLRAKLELVCKFGIRLDGGYHVDSSPEWITQSVARYLALFNTSYLDILMFHNPDDDMDTQAVAQTFLTLKNAGKVRAFGVSNFHQWEYEPLRDAMKQVGLKLSMHELEASVLHPDRITDGTVDFYSQADDNSLTILAWGPLGGDPYGGTNLLFNSTGEREVRIVQALEDKAAALSKRIKGGTSVAADQVAVAWLLQHEAGIVPILGTIKPNRISSQGVASFDVGFDQTDYEDILAELYY